MAAARIYSKANHVEGKTPFLIGVAGGTASGKSTVCKRIMEKLGQVDMDHTERQVVTISQDSFYRELSPEDNIKAAKGQFNFDHPDALNDELVYKTLQDVLAGKKCEIPVYDYRTNSIVPNQTTTVYPADVVLVEGILVFYYPEIRDLFHMKLFVDTDSDTRLARRVPRDIKERGRDLDQVLTYYMNSVKPAFEDFCLPTKKFADVIIPRGADNTDMTAQASRLLACSWEGSTQLAWNLDKLVPPDARAPTEQCWQQALEARWAHNPEVRGSQPRSATTYYEVAIDLIVHHIWDIVHGSASIQHKAVTQRRASSGSDTLSR